MGVARPLLGKINSVVMPVLKGASVGTIIFTSMSLRESYAVDSDGVIQKQNQLEMKFSEKHVEEGGTVKGWNYFFIKEVQGFRLVEVNDKLTYESADLNQLWL